MTVATDPIALAALVATLDEVAAEYTAAVAECRDRDLAREKVRQKLGDMQTAIDKAIVALRLKHTLAYGTPWYRLDVAHGLAGQAAQNQAGAVLNILGKSIPGGFIPG